LFVLLLLQFHRIPLQFSNRARGLSAEDGGEEEEEEEEEDFVPAGSLYNEMILKK